MLLGIRWTVRVGCGLGLCLGVVAAHAACAAHVESKRNRDGSEMRLLQTTCTEEGESSKLTLLIQARGVREAVVVLTEAELDADWRIGRLRDVEGEGEWALEVQGMCGAGPNCSANIYKASADRQRVYLFFEGGYHEFLKIPGYYVESGRASCCSWEYHLYTPPVAHQPLTAENFRYRLVVTANQRQPRNRCVLTDVKTERTLPIRNKHIRKLCKVYD